MLNNDSIYILIFLSGLLGGIGHCIGMCGPLIATYTISIGLSPFDRLKPHLMYHSGRLMSYGLIGGALGFSGSFVSTIKGIQHIQSIAMAIAGIVMVIMGASITGLVSKNSPSYLKRGKGGVLLRYYTSALSHGSLFPLGLINGLIPCGLSYTAFIAAAGIGASQKEPLIGFLKGLLLLLIFGIGTTPGLFLISWVSLRGATLLRKRLYALSGLFMSISGLIFLWRAIKS
jgi:sulfite exporter TauE/SafE